MEIPILVNPTLVYLPNGRELRLGEPVVDFHASPSEFVARFERPDVTVVRGAETQNGTMTWQTITRKGTEVRLDDDRHTIVLPKGSASLEGQITEVRQVGDVFVTFVKSPGGTGENVTIAFDAYGCERWRRNGGEWLSRRGGPGTVGVVEGLMLWVLDPETGTVVGGEQIH